MKRSYLLLCLGALWVGGPGCTVKEANSPPPPPPPGHQQSSANCKQEQDACVNRCRAAVPDEASRQPCYNRCMKQADVCAGR